ncbi:aromatic ring-hydroxylating dioxygenase subunit alpha [Brevibacillus fluminis]|uniref:Aromatic ring-hydroxylating dioxygenase subunit alpha n=1 Tax=Brevibacillus fluminis TaxID=511487 RepID=A0A3M8CZX9_9BACL|nr:aromatic ring-hydroxylating dioxygenase subunit alpha [Brevibacillus fluminis]RNB81188.1 aromatic ring-hydroxylating dioxygenase subunit alpha [Brevibacillus fluminis]
MSLQELLAQYTNETYTLPYPFYRDAVVLQEERLKIFSKEWQFVGHVNQVKNPGEFLTCEMAGEPIIVVRGDDDQLRAFYNVCPHRATQLEPQEQGRRKILQCSYHGWTFKLDGRLHQAPNFKDHMDSLCEEDTCLRSIQVETVASLVFVNLDNKAQSLQEAHGDFFEDLTRFSFLDRLKKHSSEKRLIKANWKAYIDNYLECDHCPIAHPAFASTFDMKSYTFVDKQSCIIQQADIKPTAKMGDVELQGVEVKEGRYYWLWPNMIFSISPGSGNIAVTVLTAVDENTTIANYTNYFVDQEPSPEQTENIKFVNQLRLEDIKLVEKAQIGFRSSAFPYGRYSPTEHALRRFHQMIKRALTE